MNITWGIDFKIQQAIFFILFCIFIKLKSLTLSNLRYLCELYSNYIANLLELDGIVGVLLNTENFPRELTVHTNKMVSIADIENRVKSVGFHVIPKDLFELYYFWNKSLLVLCLSQFLQNNE